jgi:uncharacterized protein (TIGR03435 family)
MAKKYGLSFALLVLPMWGQQFDAVLVKRSVRANQDSTIYAYPGGRVVGENVTLQTLIRVGYRVSTVQILGGPSWMASERFDVLAVGGSGSSLASMSAEIKAMLADRFKLVVREESRDVPANSLIPAKGGLRLKQSTEGDGRLMITRHSLSGRKASMDNVARALSDSLGMLIVDLTGFVGFTDIDMRWSLPSDEVKDDMPPDVYAVLSEKYGLVVKSGKVPAQVVVVDRAERPGDN